MPEPVRIPAAVDGALEGVGTQIGDWPVMKAARPAVQLCCPYQSVKIAPSLAMRSMLGVR